MNDKQQSDHEDNLCPPCEAFGGGPPACAKAWDYVSDEEEEILCDLRALKQEARSLKARIKGIRLADLPGRAHEGGRGSLARELEGAMAEMEELRKVWGELEARLKEANARKLALLGHGRPGDTTAGKE